MTRKEIKILDNLWSKAVKLRAKNKCEISGRPGSSTRLNSCHIIGRRHRATRWGALFGKEYDLCGFCATYENHAQYDQHGPMEKYIREKIIGLNRYERIRKKATQTIAKDQYFEEIQAILNKIIKENSNVY